MSKSTFEPCIPTRGTTVPTGYDGIHEIKHDGYRLIVQRDARQGHRRAGKRCEAEAELAELRGAKGLRAVPTDHDARIA